FQAEDGIRDFHVTGVQTCALPIYGLQQQVGPPEAQIGVEQAALGQPHRAGDGRSATDGVHTQVVADVVRLGDGLQVVNAARRARSEERRVGKEWRAWWEPTEQ